MSTKRMRGSEPLRRGPFEHPPYPAVRPSRDTEIERIAAVLHEIGGEFCSPFTTSEREPGWLGGHPVAMHRSQAAAIFTGLRSQPASEPSLDVERYVDRVKVFGASVAEIRYALTALDAYEPDWRARLSQPADMSPTHDRDNEAAATPESRDE